jgi:ComF family protein
MLTRGYNQTALFAKPVARELGIQYLPEAVTRVRETVSQVGLSAHERKTNISDAFQADKILVDGLIILLMDDITTTGATINECSKSLKLAGAASVFCFTLAKAKNLI